MPEAYEPKSVRFLPISYYYLNTKYIGRKRTDFGSSATEVFWLIRFRHVVTPHTNDLSRDEIARMFN